ncbi:lysosome-associated membrane glycoprotein 3 isoform X2 [Mobula birostris]|uniref:lysosome-associated membrane glycoprotein 3 isoform X2 n=1 Tax=Mobula birostris TaxID=1983395 RepID=UPI003B28A811
MGVFVRSKLYLNIMKNLVAIAALALLVPFISCARSAVVTNPVQTTFNRNSFYVATVSMTNTTTANHTTVPVTNVTTANHTTVPVTNVTAANHTTTVPVTNTTTAHHTTTVPVTTANHTTIVPVTNATAANHTTVPVTNVTTANHTTMAPVTNTTAAKHNTTSTPTVLPTLSPTATIPVTGFYNVSLKNTICIKMAIGIQLIVATKSENLYFNVPPSKTVVSGKCGNVTSWINLQFNSGFVNFTFGKDGNQYYISEIRVTLHSTNILDKTYHGIADDIKLFNAELGHSYKCKSKRVVPFSTDSLQILMVNTQVQAFNISGGMFGKAEECFVDYERVIHIIAAVIAVLIIIIIAVCLIYRRTRAAGYQRI